MHFPHNKVFVKYQAQGGVNPNPPLRTPLLVCTIENHNYFLYTATLSDRRVSDSSPLAYLRERTCKLDIGRFYTARTQRFASCAWPMVLRKLGNR